MTPEAEPTEGTPTGTEGTGTPTTQTEKPSDHTTTLLNEDDGTGAAGAETGTKGTTETAEGVPDEYADFTAPTHWEEKGLQLDAEVIAAAKPIFKELGLSQTQAQKLVDFYTGVAEKNNDAAVNSVADMRKSWRDEIAADKNIKLPEVKANYGKMLNALVPTTGSPEVIAAGRKLVADFKEAMDLTGAGDHPAFIRAVARWATRFAEGTPVQGAGPSPHGQRGAGGRPASYAEAVYPSLANRSS